MAGFWELSFDLGQLDPEVAEERCFEAGASSVTFVDAHDDPVLEPAPGEFRLWRTTRLQALFADVDEPSELTRTLGDLLQIAAPQIHARRVEDRIWEREWLHDFHAMRFGERLWVCPHHEQVTAAGACVVRLDPGLAFGTGTHPTTALCLQWLDSHVKPGGRLIDFGCGSGILAIAAVKLGAATAHCFDIDPQALLATGENAAANHVLSQVALCESVDALPRGADILVANILSGPLIELAPTFRALLRPGGSVVLAGLLDTQEAEVTRAYDAWFDIHLFESRDGWACLSGKRTTHAPVGAGK